MTERKIFKFDSENSKKIEQILAKYPADRKASAILPLLDLAQRQSGGWVSMEAMDEIALIAEVATMRVYEVASFYTMFNLKPVGKFLVQVCGTTPCMLCGAEKIMKTLETELGIKPGQSTEDGMFSLVEVECLGACVNAPIVQINDDFVEDISPENIAQIVKTLKNGKNVKIGSYKNRQCSKPLSEAELKNQETENAK